MSKSESPITFEWDEIAAALFAAQKITKGYWFLGVGMVVGATSLPWKNGQSGVEAQWPSVQMGFQAIVLTPAQGPGPMVFDAAKLTPGLPARPSRKKATAKRVTSK